MAATGQQIKPTSIEQISQIIKSKEQELHAIHELRCEQLEELVQERDNLLLESGHRFDQLKEDFQFNLLLIEARDKEINRLEEIIDEQAASIQECDGLRKQAFLKLESLEQREKEREKKLASDKVVNKQIFDELRDVIESMKWAAEEEAQSKAKEIEYLRKEIRNAHVQKEESLESQRKDLTDAFEKILHQREDSFSSKERDIAQQIHVLDNRFEQLQTENTKLKKELSVSCQKVEELTKDTSSLEENKRLLQWQIEDLRNSTVVSDDAMQRQLQEMTKQVSNLKEALQRDKFEYERKIEKSGNELLRETEHRQILEAKLNEVRASAQNDISSLETELAELKRSEESLLTEANMLREERDKVSRRAAALHLETETSDVKLKLQQKEGDALRVDNQELRALNLRLELSVSERDSTIAHLQDKLSELTAKMEQQSNMKQLESKLLTQEEMNNLNNKHSKELANLEIQHSRALEAKVQELTEIGAVKLASAEEKYQDKCDELAKLKEQIKDMQHALDEEKTEAAALKLRLRLNETANMNLTQDLKRAQQAAASTAAGGAGGGGGSGTTNSMTLSLPQRAHASQAPFSPARGNNNNNNNNDNSLASFSDLGGLSILASPTFSEDYGPASFPQSSPTPHYGGQNGNSNGGRVAARFGFDPRAAGEDTTSTGAVAGAGAGTRHGESSSSSNSNSNKGTGRRGGGADDENGHDFDDDDDDYYRGAKGEVERKQTAAAAAAPAVGLNGSKVAAHATTTTATTSNSGTGTGTTTANNSKAVEEENERLKRIIKDMRSEVETLRLTKTPEKQPQVSISSSTSSGQQDNTVPSTPERRNNNNNNNNTHIGRDTAGTTLPSSSTTYTNTNTEISTAINAPISPEQVALLEKRLAQTADEVARLRRERLKLMDTGNQLRAQLNKTAMFSPPHGHHAPNNNYNNNNTYYNNNNIDNNMGYSSGYTNNNNNNNSNSSSNNYNGYYSGSSPPPMPALFPPQQQQQQPHLQLQSQSIRRQLSPSLPAPPPFLPPPPPATATAPVPPAVSHSVWGSAPFSAAGVSAARAARNNTDNNNSDTTATTTATTSGNTGARRTVLSPSAAAAATSSTSTGHNGGGDVSESMLLGHLDDEGDSSSSSSSQRAVQPTGSSLRDSAAKLGDIAIVGHQVNHNNTTQQPPSLSPSNSSANTRAFGVKLSNSLLHTVSSNKRGNVSSKTASDRQLPSQTNARQRINSSNRGGSGGSAAGSYANSAEAAKKNVMNYAKYLESSDDNVDN